MLLRILRLPSHRRHPRRPRRRDLLPPLRPAPPGLLLDIVPDPQIRRRFEVRRDPPRRPGDDERGSEEPKSQIGHLLQRGVRDVAEHRGRERRRIGARYEGGEGVYAAAPEHDVREGGERGEEQGSGAASGEEAAGAVQEQGDKGDGGGEDEGWVCDPRVEGGDDADQCVVWRCEVEECRCWRHAQVHYQYLQMVRYFVLIFNFLILIFACAFMI